MLSSERFSNITTTTCSMGARIWHNRPFTTQPTTARQEAPAFASKLSSFRRCPAGQSSTAVEKQIHSVVSPRVELARRHGYAHTHGATLRLSNDHMQKLRG